MLAAEQGRSLSSVVITLLMEGLTLSALGNITLSLRGWEASLQPGADIIDRAALLDQMDALASPILTTAPDVGKDN
jgi:cell division protein FtsX